MQHGGEVSWASHAIAALGRGESCKVTPHGNSMRPIVSSGATVTLAPYADGEEPAEGDVVLVKVKGVVHLHLVNAVRGGAESRQYQMGNNRGGVNGWVSRRAVYGRFSAYVPSRSNCRCGPRWPPAWRNARTSSKLLACAFDASVCMDESGTPSRAKT